MNIYGIINLIKELIEKGIDPIILKLFFYFYIFGVHLSLPIVKKCKFLFCSELSLFKYFCLMI